MIHDATVIVTLGALVGACATPTPTELLAARAAYARAATGPAVQWAPAELHKAKQALSQAEQSWVAEDNSYRTRDLAYVAERRAALSEAVAGTAKEAAEARAAEAEYRRTQGRLVAQSRELLYQTRQQLAEKERAQEKTAAELEAERAARATAEERAAEANRRLKSVEERLASLAAVRQEPRGLVITLSGSVLFPSNQSTLLPEAEARLNQVADALMSTKERTLLIEGYTDSRGSPEHNLMLSQERADSVRAYLVGRGYDPNRIVARGYGSAKPVADNGTPEGRANNRRVEIVVTPAP
jgi:outer membrane protein OmpA-like peptidoglycan-associated protein